MEGSRREKGTFEKGDFFEDLRIDSPPASLVLLLLAAFPVILVIPVILMIPLIPRCSNRFNRRSCAWIDSFLRSLQRHFTSVQQISKLSHCSQDPYKDPDEDPYQDLFRLPVLFLL